MRVLIFTSSSNLSGGTRQAMYQARGLLERGHDVHLFAVDKAKGKTLEPDLPWRELSLDFASAKKALEAYLDPARPCIVHAYHNRSLKLVAALGLFWRLRGWPVACLGHRGVIYRPNNPLPYLSPGMRAFTTNSTLCAQIIRKISWGLKPVEVIPNAIPRERITPRRAAAQVRAELNISGTELVAGFVGNDDPVKGFQVLLPAFAASGLSKVVLLAVGVYRPVWEEVLRELKLESRVRLVAPTPDVADYLQIMDFFLIPSLSESQPNTVLEAMSLGVPVGGSAVGGVPELLQDNALLTPPNDQAALAALLQRLAADAALRAAISRRNLAKAGEFTLAARLDKLEDLYGRLLRKLRP